MLRMTSSFAISSLSVLLAVLPACGDSEFVGDGSGNAAASAPTSTQRDLVDTAVAAESFTTLVAAAQAADLEATLRSPGPFTVFAPSDAAFRSLPSFLTKKLLTAPYKAELALILKYHVVAGSIRGADVLGQSARPSSVLGALLAVDGSTGKVIVNGSANVTTADVEASNGIIHIVDSVLLPTITDTAVGYDDGTTTFKTLVAALTAGELAETLGGAGPFTVFAPSDAAFAKLPKATIDSLLLPENKPKLQTLLKYHVVAGTPIYAKDVASGTMTTLSGAVTVRVTGANVELDAGGGKSSVVLTDLPARNGVTHVIDTVILPPS